jgi:hypothetical protein
MAVGKGLDVLLARTEEIKKFHTHVLAHLADAQRDEIVGETLSVVTPPIVCRSAAKGLTACSALLFHGTPSKLRNLNILFRIFANDP